MQKSNGTRAKKIVAAVNEEDSEENDEEDEGEDDEVDLVKAKRGPERRMVPVFDGQVVHAFSRLDPHYEPTVVPRRSDGSRLRWTGGPCHFST